MGSVDPWYPIRCEGLPTRPSNGWRIAVGVRNASILRPFPHSVLLHVYCCASPFENRRTLALALPIVAGFVGQMLMGLADTIMVGRLGVTPLAAGAFANTLLAVPLVFGFATLSSVSVRASHAFGGGRNQISGEALRAGLGIELFLAFSWPPQLTAHFRSYLGLARALKLTLPPRIFFYFAHGPRCRFLLRRQRRTSVRHFLVHGYPSGSRWQACCSTSR